LQVARHRKIVDDIPQGRGLDKQNPMWGNKIGRRIGTGHAHHDKREKASILAFSLSGKVLPWNQVRASLLTILPSRYKPRKIAPP
jgi:hypothetical protein